MSPQTYTSHTGCVHAVKGTRIVGEHVVNPNDPSDVMGYREVCVTSKCGSAWADEADVTPVEVTCKRCLKASDG